MYEEIKGLAVEAVKLQNKLNMEATLHEIMDLCDKQARDVGCCGECSTDGPIAAGDVLVAADGQEFKVDAVVAEPMGLDQAIAAIKSATKPQGDVMAVPKKTRAKVAK